MYDSRFFGTSLLQRVLLISLFSLIVLTAPAQKRVKLKHADAGKGGKDPSGERFQRLLGHVEFQQNQTTIFCDSAHFYKQKNSIEAYGHVHIVDGDSIDITAHRLSYDGDSKQARLRQNVVFTKLGTATLYTDYLDYSRQASLASYFNGGKLVDSINVLTSSKGYYNVNSNLASFKKNVKVVNPDYTMFSDSLQYNSRTKDIYFVAETTVINKDSSTFVYSDGVYNTISKKSDIRSGVGESNDYMISGDKYDVDAIRNIYKVRGNVEMKSKKENLIIYGQASDYFKNIGITKVYNNAYVAKITEENDTLFMSADTLVSIDHQDPAKKRLLAYNNVKIFKRDLQGIADSLEYRSIDSTIYFYKAPILWSDGNQMTSDSISMLIENNTIGRIFMVGNAFVVSKDTLANFNQIKGRRMTAYFSAGKISQVIVEGNGESLYYAFDDKTKVIMGLNKIICSNITIRFKDGKVNNLTFYIQPDANFIPPHELKQEDRYLKGFQWQEKVKPARKDVVKDAVKVNNKKPKTSLQ
jgi:lipopolysaccharide export system protein LptA